MSKKTFSLIIALALVCNLQVSAFALDGNFIQMADNGAIVPAVSGSVFDNVYIQNPIGFEDIKIKNVSTGGFVQDEDGYSTEMSQDTSDGPKFKILPMAISIVTLGGIGFGIFKVVNKFTGKSRRRKYEDYEDFEESHEVAYKKSTSKRSSENGSAGSKSSIKNNNNKAKSKLKKANNQQESGQVRVAKSSDRGHIHHSSNVKDDITISYSKGVHARSRSEEIEEAERVLMERLQNQKYVKKKMDSGARNAIQEDSRERFRQELEADKNATLASKLGSIYDQEFASDFEQSEEKQIAAERRNRQRRNIYDNYTEDIEASVDNSIKYDRFARPMKNLSLDTDDAEEDIFSQDILKPKKNPKGDRRFRDTRGDSLIDEAYVSRKSTGMDFDVISMMEDRQVSKSHIDNRRLQELLEEDEQEDLEYI